MQPWPLHVDFYNPVGKSDLSLFNCMSACECTCQWMPPCVQSAQCVCLLSIIPHMLDKSNFTLWDLWGAQVYVSGQLRKPHWWWLLNEVIVIWTERTSVWAPLGPVCSVQLKQTQQLFLDLLNSQTKDSSERFARGALSLTILTFLIRYPDTCRTYIYHVWPRLGDRFLCRSCCQDVSRSRDQAVPSFVRATLM